MDLLSTDNRKRGQEKNETNQTIVIRSIWNVLLWQVVLMSSLS